MFLREKKKKNKTHCLFRYSYLIFCKTRPTKKSFFLKTLIKR